MFRRCLLCLPRLSCRFAFAAGKPSFQTPGPVHLDKAGEKWAQKSLKKMSLEQKVGQMFMIWSHAQFLNVNNPEYLALRDTMRKYHLGGFGLTVDYEDGFLYKNEPLEAAMITNQLQKDSEFPLIFAADFERGLGMRLNEATGLSLTPWPLAPPAISTSPASPDASPPWKPAPSACSGTGFPTSMSTPIPTIRSSTPALSAKIPTLVGEMAAAYIEGAHEFGMLTTAKHFPGHGDTDIDSHLSVPRRQRRPGAPRYHRAAAVSTLPSRPEWTP